MGRVFHERRHHEPSVACLVDVWIVTRDSSKIVVVPVSEPHHVLMVCLDWYHYFFATANTRGSLVGYLDEDLGASSRLGHPSGDS